MTDPHAFSSLMHSLSPDEVHQTAEEVRALIAIGETELQNVTEHRDEKLEIRDAAKSDRDVAQNSLTDTLGLLGDANDQVVKLETQLAAAKDSVTTATDAKTAADERQVVEEGLRDEEIARVEDERDTLEHVKDLLEDILPDEVSEQGTEEPEEEEPEEPADDDLSEALIGLTSNPRRKLLSMSRTTRILSDPSFINTLANADPQAVLEVIELIDKMIAAGEDDIQAAVDKAQAAADAAVEAGEVLDEANAHQTLTESLLSAEKVTVSSLETERDNKQVVVDEKNDILDDAQAKLDIWEVILHDESTRIGGERGILEDAEKKLLTLEDVIKTLE